MMRAKGMRNIPQGTLPTGPPYQCKATSLLYYLEPLPDPRPEAEREGHRIPDCWHMVPTESLVG
eukprot:9079168-Lingulodinium_polyedra.AAC.1